MYVGCYLRIECNLTITWLVGQTERLFLDFMHQVNAKARVFFKLIWMYIEFAASKVVCLANSNLNKKKSAKPNKKRGKWWNLTIVLSAIAKTLKKSNQKNF
jgi:hypothetical protein